MADWTTCYDWMMDFEDAQREYKQVPDSAPVGVDGPCFAISGINSGAWPDDFAEIADRDQASRATPVKQFYQDRFWSHWLEKLASDEVAKRVFDLAVNGGIGTSARILQRALNTLQSGTVNADGLWGPGTIAAANAADPAALIDAFRQQRIAHYQSIADKNPAKKRYLDNWTARANK